MASKITPFLMFEGIAEEAMNFYVALFNDAEITRIERYGSDQQGAEGSVMSAEFSLNGQQFMCIDSPEKHDFRFTPALSIFVECENEAEIDRVFTHLSEDGVVLMPLGNYGFSQKFGWTNDRFGVSWQLNWV